MTDIVMDTVITISLKEYAEMKARLDALEQAAQELQEDLLDWNESMHFGAGDPTTLVSYQNMAKLLDGDK